jgi:hypothetical protein
MCQTLGLKWLNEIRIRAKSKDGSMSELTGLAFAMSRKTLLFIMVAAPGSDHSAGKTLLLDEELATKNGVVFANHE